MATGWINEISQILESVLEKNEEQFIDVFVPQVQEHTVGKERILQIDEEVDEVLQKVPRDRLQQLRNRFRVPQTKVAAVQQYVTMDVFQEMNTAVAEKMKDLMTECAEYAERHENAIEMLSPLMRNVERLSDEMEKMAVTVGRLSDTTEKMVVAVGWTTDTTEKLAGRVGRHARLFDEDEDEIEECMICAEPSTEVLCEECTHERFAWKGVGKGARRWTLPQAQRGSQFLE